MFQIDDDINDELFRRAADGYPLKTDNPDFEAVLHKIKENDKAGAVQLPKKRKNNYRYLLLLLLLLIPWAIFESRKTAVSESLSGQTNSTERAGTVKGTSSEIAPETAAKNITPPSTALNESDTDPIDLPSTNSGRTPIQDNVQPNHKTVLADSNSNGVIDNSVAPGKKQNLSSKQRSRVSIKNAAPEADEEIVVRYPSSKDNSKQKINSAASTVETTDIQKEVAVETKTTVPEVAMESTQPASSPDKAAEESDKKEKNDITTPATKATDKEIVKNKEPKSVKENKEKKPRNKHFYAGLIASPDMSAVKLQSVKRVGFNYGILLGYRLTKKISIETGLLQDRKYYSTDGKYFDSKNVYVSPYAKIEYVDGVCKMLELPLNISYTFRKKARSSWFGSAGVSSYFMQHESYVYDVSYYGYRYPKSYEYNNKSTSLLALINISAGFTYKIGKIGDLRVEPYVKLPVSKIGTGKLPIQSGGIFIGFTKDIF